MLRQSQSCTPQPGAGVLPYPLIWVLLSNLPIRNPHNQTQIHQSEYLSMNSTFALCWKEINCRSNGLSILSIWESFTPTLWSPDGGNTIYLLRGPSFNSLDAGSWPVTRHVTASRDVTCPRHPQHHVSPRVTVSTTSTPSLMYYYLNYSCLITHYTLHITHYTLHITRYTLHVTHYKHFLLWHCDKWRVILRHSDLNIH